MRRIKAGPLAVWAAGVVVGVGLAAAALSAGVSQYLEASDPATALAWRPGSSTAVAREAEAAFRRGDSAEAERLARRALAASPRNVAALRILALSAEREQKPAIADSLMTIAGRWSLRDTGAQLWLFNRRLAQGRYYEAMRHGDALLRRTTVNSGLVQTEMISAAAADPRALSALADRLAMAPSWRTSFLGSLGRRTGAADVNLRLLLRLQSTARPPTDDEISFYLLPLTVSEQYGRAFADWRRLLPKASRPGALVPNGGFDDRPAADPFRWTAPEASGAVVEYGPPPGRPRERALRVDHSGYGKGPLLRQMLVLPPGSYQLSVDTYLETAESAGASWAIYCVAGPQGEARAVTQGSPMTWGRIQVRFAIEENCRAQWLELRAPESDRRRELAAWFDNVTVTHEQ